MSWGPFSAEAVTLDSKLRKLHREGRASEAVDAIEDALKIAHRVGPSNIGYALFEALGRAALDPSNEPAK